jgi:hypothetical protein
MNTRPLLYCSAFLALASTRAIPATQSGRDTALKYIPLNSDGSVNLSLGGELRERFEYYSEPAFGLRGLDEDSCLLHRLMLSADLHAGQYFHPFLQLGNHLKTGKQAARSPSDVDEFDVQQAFVDLILNAPVKLMLRAGRQEITFGSGRLVSVREGANVRRSFDGARLTFASGPAIFDAFAVNGELKNRCSERRFKPARIILGALRSNSTAGAARRTCRHLLPWFGT